jgi:hypothetical protein
MLTPFDTQQVMPSEWGARVDTTRPWPDDDHYRPTVTVVHYFGGHNPAGGDEVGLPPYSFDIECKYLRLAEGWHMDPHRPGGPMRAIAYNEGYGQSGHHYYLRGPQHVNGGHYGDINKTSRAVVFILGGAQVPSLQARRMFGRMMLEDPLSGIVKCHEDYYKTACPGAFLIGWVDRLGWLYDLGEWKEGSQGGVVSSIKVALHNQGFYKPAMFGPGFGLGLTNAVKRFQAAHGLTVDGIVGHDTFAALGSI